MIFQVHKYCSKCFDSSPTRFTASKVDPDCFWCGRCYSDWYNHLHREDKNRKSRMRARFLAHNTKVKKPRTPTQIANTRRHLKYQLKQAELMLDFLKYLNTPTVPLRHNTTNSDMPGVS